MITDIYDFYYDESGKLKDGSKLQEVNKSESDLNLNLDTKEAPINPTNLELSEPTSEIVPNSIELSNLILESKELGSLATDSIIKIIEPAVKSAVDKTLKLIKDKSEESVIGVRMAKILEEDEVNKIPQDPMQEILDQLTVEIKYLVGKTVDEINESFSPELKQKVVESLDLIVNNEITKEEVHDKINVKVGEIIESQVADLKTSFATEVEVKNDSNSGDLIDEITERINNFDIESYWTKISDRTDKVIDSLFTSYENIVVDFYKGIALDSWEVPLNYTVDQATSILTSLGSIFSESVAVTLDLISDLSKDVLNIPGSYLNKVNNSITDALATIRGYGENIKNILRNAFKTKVKLSKYDEGVIRYKYLKNESSKEPKDEDLIFVTSFDWVIRIRIPRDLTDLPSLPEYLGSTVGNIYLPIIAYSITEESLNPVFHQFLSSSVPLPIDYRRPSRLSLNLPQVYIEDREGKFINGLKSFKRDYIEYVKCNDKTGLTSRDFRECYYEITIYRFPYKDRYNYSYLYDKVVDSKTYFCIPDISISESGDSTKTIVTEQLTFSIIGEKDGNSST